MYRQGWLSEELAGGTAAFANSSQRLRLSCDGYTLELWEMLEFSLICSSLGIAFSERFSSSVDQRVTSKAWLVSSCSRTSDMIP